MKAKLISIIIPTYQGLAQLRNCALPSIVNQTYQRFEVIIVNDGVCPETRRFVDSLNRRKGPFKNKIIYHELEKEVFKNKKEQWANGGGRSRNWALGIARGDLIAPLDQDDLWSPRMLESRIRYFGKHNNAVFTFAKAICVYSNSQLDARIGVPLTDKIYVGYKQQNGGANYVPHLTVVYTKKLAHYRYPNQGTIPADYSMWKYMIMDGILMDFIDEDQGIRNGRENSFKVIAEIYKKNFKAELKPL